ncbi:MAG: ParB/RepB/Spo0J family partition protein [Gemmatimonadaceae bacterium]|nr:ParB/RepB/Spo0J family partition protein [Gemmatimonadaceae bacterium]
MGKRRREVLGKGIHALITEYPESDDGPQAQVVELPVGDIEPNPHQPRLDFDDQGLRELADSIREKGIIQPLAVNRTSASSYHLILGERRLRAARLVGLETVPAIVHQIESAQDLMELALVENIQREDLNPIEEAEAYRALMSTCMLTQEQIASRVGKDRSTVANALRLLRLPEEVQEMLRAGELQMGHARTLVSLDEKAALDLGRRCAAESMSVRDLERAVRGLGKGRKRRPKEESPGGGAADAVVADFESRLRQRFATAIAIRRRRGKGSIEIEFYGDDDLERLLGLLLPE